MTSRTKRLHEVIRKLHRLFEWGVHNLWLIDPINKRFSTYTAEGLHDVPHFSMRGRRFKLTRDEIFGR